MAARNVDDVGENVDELSMLLEQARLLNERVAKLVLVRESAPKKAKTKSTQVVREINPDVVKVCPRCKKDHCFTTKWCGPCLDHRINLNNARKSDVKKPTVFVLPVTFHGTKEDLASMGYVLPAKDGVRLHIYIENGMLVPKPVVTKSTESTSDDDEYHSSSSNSSPTSYE